MDYATQAGGNLNGLGYDTSLDFGPGDIPHISYNDEGNKDLKYATWEQNAGGGGFWNIQRVDTMGKVGKDTSIDVSGNIYITYYDDSNKDLKFAWKAVGAAAWQYEVADNGGGSSNLDKYDVGEDTSLEIGSDGRPRISFHQETNEDLDFAIRTDICGVPGTWEIQHVDTIGDQGEDNSLARKSDDTPCISYHDESNGNLKFACQASAPPAVTVILPSGPINATSTMISADYADNSGMGINLASVAVYLDGTLRTGCTAGATHVSCPASASFTGTVLKRSRERRRPA